MPPRETSRIPKKDKRPARSGPIRDAIAPPQRVAPRRSPPRDAIYHRPAPAPPPPRSEAAAGRGYGLQKANRYKRTRDYKQTVGAGKPDRPSDVRSRGGYGVRRANEFKATEQYRRQVQLTLEAAAGQRRPRVVSATPVLRNILYAAGHPVGTTEVARTGRRGHGVLPGATSQAGLVGSPFGSYPGLVVKNVGLATYEDPFGVAGHTAKGLAEIIAGTPAGIAGLVRHPSTLGQLPGAVASDFSRRYGPLAKGDEETFRKRLREEGLAPELLDATVVLGAAGATAGRAAGAAARAGKLGGRLERIATERPDLRITGNLAVPQDVAPNLFRAVGQRGEDIVRQRVKEHRNRGGVPRGVQPQGEGPVTRTGLSPTRHEVVPIFTERAQRVAVSRRGGRSYLANRSEQARELQRGVERDLAGLKPRQREAVFHAMQGVVPLVARQGESKVDFIGRVRGALQNRRAQITAHLDANPNDPRPVSDLSELKTLDRLEEHADEIFGDGRLAAFHERNLPRSRRLAELDPGVGNLDAVRHPFRVQGESLGHRYDPGDLEGPDLKAYDDAFIANVRQESSKRGLPEPAYFRHQEFPTSGFGVRTAANLYRATAGPKHSELKLFRRGSAITDPDVFVQGLAGNIKRRHQWNAVANTVEAHAYQWSRGRSGAGRSLLDIKREIQRRGLSFDDFEFVNFGRFRRAAETADPLTDTSSDLRAALEEGVVKSERVIKGTDDELAKTRGFVAVPKGVGEELKAAINPAGKPVRVLGKVQGIQSAAILGLNLSWLEMQVAANTLIYGIGAHGDFKALASQKWFKDLPEPMQRRLEQYGGVGVGRGHASQPHLGSQGGSLARGARAVGQIPLIRSKRGTLRVTDLNPTHPLFALDELQNRTFRQGALLQGAKREAYRNIRKEMGAAAEAQVRVSNLLRLKPDETLAKQVERVLENPQAVEKLGQHVDRILGDYLRFTAQERKWLKPTVLFYGFFRYALKTLFYTLPVHHPIAAAIAGKVGQLHDEEVRELFKTRDVPPWIFSRLYSVDKNGKPIRDSKGQLLAIDLARINPVTSPITEAVQTGPKAFGGLLSPMLQAIEDQRYARSSFTGRGFRVQGSAEENPNPNIGSRARIFTNDLLSAAFPYREAVKLTQRGTHGDDTLLGSPRPIRYKTAGPQAQEAERRRILPSPGEQLRSDLAPLVFPKQDTTEAFLERHPPSDRTAPSRPRSREERLLLREAQQAQEEAAMTERERQMLIREALAG